MSQMDVSVVIPAFNRAQTILRALDSVLAQKGVSFEVLIVDDGSTDGTKASVAPHLSATPPKYGRMRPLAQKKADPSSGGNPPPAERGEGRRGVKVRYVYQSNQGPSAARNLGIKYARAPFIAFLDSDDEWLPGKLSAQLEFFDQNPDYVICQTNEIWIRHGRRVNPMKKHRKFGGFIFKKCLALSIVSPSCVMMRRDFFVPPPEYAPKAHWLDRPNSGGGIDRVGLFDETLPACEDYDLWLRASARFPIGFIEKPYVIKHGGHEDQRSRQFPVMDRFRIRALLKLLGSGILNESQREFAIEELVRKCTIVSQGAVKRGRTEEARYYEDLIERVNSTVIARRPSRSLGRHCEPRRAG